MVSQRTGRESSQLYWDELLSVRLLSGRPARPDFSCPVSSCPPCPPDSAATSALE